MSVIGDPGLRYYELAVVLRFGGLVRAGEEDVRGAGLASDHPSRQQGRP